MKIFLSLLCSIVTIHGQIYAWTQPDELSCNYAKIGVSTYVPAVPVVVGYNGDWGPCISMNLTGTVQNFKLSCFHLGDSLTERALFAKSYESADTGCTTDASSEIIDVEHVAYSSFPFNAGIYSIDDSASNGQYVDYSCNANGSLACNYATIKIHGAGCTDTASWLKAPIPTNADNGCVPIPSYGDSVSINCTTAATVGYEIWSYSSSQYCGGTPAAQTISSTCASYTTTNVGFSTDSTGCSSYTKDTSATIPPTTAQPTAVAPPTGSPDRNPDMGAAFGLKCYLVAIVSIITSFLL